MKILNKLGEVGANLARLGTQRLVLLGVTGLAVMLSVALAAHYLSRPTMQAIYTGLSAQDVSRMTAALAEAGVPFDVNEQRNAVLVAFGQAGRARTLLAQKGLPTSSRAGYELFDQLGSMGLTSFMQEVTRVRALEGEIARTIQGVDGVAAARVHLVLPEAGTFRRDRRDPSASVLLRLDTRWQAAAAQTVRHMVAAAIPGMKAEQVSVASTDGRLLATAGEEGGPGSYRLAEMERSMAMELEQRAGRTLAKALGSGNYQVSITLRLDVDRQQVNETFFDPKSRIERSIRTVKQSGSTEDGGSKPTVGVEANIPRPEPGQGDGDRRRQREDKREELVNYEINSRQVQTVREGYRVQRLAVAIVVNRKQLAAQLGGNVDAAQIEARLNEIKRLVIAATGADQASSSIEISASEFGDGEGGLPPVPAPGLVDHLMMNIGVIVNALIMLAIVSVVVLFGLRPLMAVLGRTDVSTANGGPTPLGSSFESVALGTMGGESDARPFGPVSLTDAGGGQRPDAPDAAVRARLEALVSADEEKVAKVMKNWIAEGRQA